MGTTPIDFGELVGVELRRTIMSTGVMRVLRAVLVLVVLGASLLWTAGPAQACSCAAPDVSQGLDFSDAALVGTFVGLTGDERRGGDFGPEVGYGFEVETWVKGTGPATATVWSSSDGSSCGLEVRPGQRIGLFVRSQGGEFRSDLCSTIAANMLMSAMSEDLIVGEGLAHFVVAGGFSEGAIAYLDSQARPLGYLIEPEPGGWDQLEPCPGGTAAIFQRGDSGLEIVDLVTGDRSPIDLGLDSETAYVADVVCLAPDGSDVSVLVERFTNQPIYTVGRIDPEPRNLGNLPSIRGGQPLLVGDKVIVAESNEAGGRLSLFDPETGAMTTVAQVGRDGSGNDHAGYDQPVGSPDGARVAIVESVYRSDDTPSHTVLVVDVETGEMQRSPATAGEWWGVTWLDDTHLGLSTSTDGRSSDFVVVDATTFEEIAVLDTYSAFGGVKVGEEIWGVDGSEVQHAMLPEGSTAIAHTFAASVSNDLIAIAEPFAPPELLAAPAVGGKIDAPPPTQLPQPDDNLEDEQAGISTSGSGADSGAPNSRWVWVAGAAVIAALVGLVGLTFRLLTNNRGT